jgi:peptidylprolyl isomerase
MKTVALALIFLALVGWMISSSEAGDKDKKEEKVITTKSGLKYVELKAGDGKEAKKGDTVHVHYVGTLTSGKKFDSSRDRGEPFVFELGAGKVIKGWDEGVAGIKEGGKRKLIIPPELAYGNREIGNGLIPANSTLIFEVELVKVK